MAVGSSKPRRRWRWLVVAASVGHVLLAGREQRFTALAADREYVVVQGRQPLALTRP